MPEWFEGRLYAGTELAPLLREAGFAEVTLFGWLDGRPKTTKRAVSSPSPARRRSSGKFLADQCPASQVAEHSPR